jgi:hypothetical protein
MRHELSSEERQPYLIRAKPTALDLENVLISRVVQINWEQ